MQKFEVRDSCFSAHHRSEPVRNELIRVGMDEAEFTAEYVVRVSERMIARGPGRGITESERNYGTQCMSQSMSIFKNKACYLVLAEHTCTFFIPCNSQQWLCWRLFIDFFVSNNQPVSCTSTVSIYTLCAIQSVTLEQSVPF
jgi:hypothetical protein